MTLYIVIKADGLDAAPVRSLWSRVGALEDRPSMEALGYPPHITFAAYDLAMEAEAVRALGAFADCGPLDIEFRAIRMFEGDDLVLWLEPVTPNPLSSLHAALHSRIDPLSCHPYYRPEDWVPHCTLATSVPLVRRADALALMAESFTPFTVRFNAVECVENPPLRIIAGRSLNARSA